MERYYELRVIFKKMFNEHLNYLKIYQKFYDSKELKSGKRKLINE